jgi:23S rRNA (pseudouridine1915-N3)-methyltransferase
MKIQLWAVGKINEPYVKQGIDDFTARIAKYYPVRWTIIPPPKNASALAEPALRKKEAAEIDAMLHKEDYLVVLDEKGRQLSSTGMAQFISTRANESVKNLIFLIGGAYGTDETILKRANFTWSLSQLTFPHQLVRLLLAEQLYRACSIIRNEKYHHA